MSNQPDAIVIGSGPNGLAAAIVLAQAGLKVILYESRKTIGGGARTAELTLPGFHHDVGSAVHPFAVVSPFFKSLGLERHGLDWVYSPAMLAHPLDNGDAAVVERSLEKTAEALGQGGRDYTRLIGYTVRNWQRVQPFVLGPLGLPRHPVVVSRFGIRAVRSAAGVARRFLHGDRERALFAGMAAHGVLPLDRAPSAAFGLVLGALAHVAGWPIPRGGAQRIADALAARLRALGGEIVTSAPVRTLDELPPARAILCDLSPKPFLVLAGGRLPAAYRAKLERYRYGPGAFKVDWALDSPIPWRAAACQRAATVHIGGSLEEIASSERDAWEGRHSERPFVLLAQPSLFDASRAPEGQHTAWAYCHTPNGSTFDMLPRIERQIERFAPGFRERILARAVATPADLERWNPNLAGGDISAGANTLAQLFARPTWGWHATPVRGLYLCSASTPPGAAVHGMCGFFAAQRALKEVFQG